MLGIVLCKDSVDATQKAASAISDVITAYKDQPILFLVSGGSPLGLLNHLSPNPFGSRVTIGVSDERFSKDPTINTCAQVLQSTWYSGVASGGVKSIDTRPLPGETVDEAGGRYDRALKAWKNENPTGKIVITQGIGLDGHTAGMMPYPENPVIFESQFVTTKLWAVGYDAKEKNKYSLRVTTTVPFLRMVDDAIVYVCGIDKKKPLEDTFAPAGSLAVTPARILHEMKNVQIFTDQQMSLPATTPS